MPRLIVRTGQFACLSLLALLAACAPAATQYAPFPEDMKSAPAPGMARICVIRGWIMTAMAVDCRLADHGVPLGDLPNGSYVCWEREPGVAHLTIRTWDPLFASQGNLPVEPDMVYYLYMDYFHQQLKSISHQEGQKYLAEYARPLVARDGAPTSNMAAQPAATGAAAQTIAPLGGAPASPAGKSAGY